MLIPENAVYFIKNKQQKLHDQELSSYSHKNKKVRKYMRLITVTRQVVVTRTEMTH